MEHMHTRTGKYFKCEHLMSRQVTQQRYTQEKNVFVSLFHSILSIGSMEEAHDWIISRQLATTHKELDAEQTFKGPSPSDKTGFYQLVTSFGFMRK